MAIRLQKILSEAGVASRREAETIIVAGRVTVNGKVVRELGSRADPAVDHIRLDGRPISRPSPKVYYLLYKPKGVITSMKDPQGRPTIKGLTHPIRSRVFPVGRLDYDAEGLVLLTNDGDLALKLSHPRYGVPRTYEVKVKGVLSAEEIRRAERGVMLEDGVSPSMKVKPLRKLTANSWLRVTLREGRNRIIKRTFSVLGHPVVHLRRVKYASLTLEGLRPGEYRALSPDETKALRAWE